MAYSLHEKDTALTCDPSKLSWFNSVTHKSTNPASQAEAQQMNILNSKAEGVSYSECQ